MQWHYFQITLAGHPLRAVSIDLYMGYIIGLKLVKFHQDDTAFFAEWRMDESRRVAEIGPSAKVTAVIRKSPLQHQNFFAQ